MKKSITGFNYDRKQWKLEHDSYNNLFLVRQSDPDSRYILGASRNIRALNEISENLFIVLEGYPSRGYYIRFYDISIELTEISSILFYDSYEFWSDTIVFVDGKTVYDITSGNAIDGFLSAMQYLYDNDFYDIQFIQKDSQSYFYSTAEITSNNGGKDFLQLLLDIRTCKPALPVHSTLRNSLISLTDTFTLEDLIREEKRYKRIVDLHHKEEELLEGKNILLSAFA